METKSFKLKEILEEIESRRQPNDIELLKVVSNKVMDVVLTYAETILLTEGIQSGIADCTLGCYVTEEGDVKGKMSDTFIRSEFLEWILDSAISKTIIKSGSLRIEGATILSSLDYNGENIDISDREREVENDKDRRYSLNLESRTILVDLEFISCRFIKGINFSNSYTENLIFRKIEIGKTDKDNYQNKKRGDRSITAAISLDLSYTTINGSVEISTSVGVGSKSNLKDIKGDILFNYAKIENSITINDEPNRKVSFGSDQKVLRRKMQGQLGNIEGLYLQTKSIEIQHCVVNGYINFDYCSVETVISLFGSKILERDKLYSDEETRNGCSIQNAKLRVLEANDVAVYYPFDITFSNIEEVFFVGSILYGHPISLKAGGIKSQFVSLNEGFTACYGAHFHKSIIERQFDCRSGSYFISEDVESPNSALRIDYSKVGNLFLSDGFAAIGEVDFHNGVFENIDLSKALIKNVNESFESDQQANTASNFESSSYAINGKNCVVTKKISFNPPLSINKSSKLNRASRQYELLQSYGDTYRIWDIKLKTHNTLTNQSPSFAEQKDELLIKFKKEKDNLDDLEKRSYKNEQSYKALNKQLVDYKKKDSNLNGEQIRDIHQSLLECETIHNNYQAKIKTNTINLAKLDYDLITTILERINKDDLVDSDPTHEMSLLKIEFSYYNKLVILNELYQTLFQKLSSKDNFLNFSLLIGECHFEEIIVNGDIDCAGAFFYRNLILSSNQSSVGYRYHPVSFKYFKFRALVFYSWFLSFFSKKKQFLVQRYLKRVPNSLTLSYSNINGTLYLNTGDGLNKLSCLVNGEVDLQYSYIKTLSISPSLSVGEWNKKVSFRETRWNLIGTTYDSIYAQYERCSEQSTLGKFLNPIQALFSYRFLKPNKLYRAKWIYPYYGNDNFRQPYEQLSNTLFNSGDDWGARTLVVWHTPSRNIGEWLVMAFLIRPLFFITFPIQRALISLIAWVLLGSYFFALAYEHCLLKESKDSEHIPFQPLFYAAQKSLLLSGGEQEKSFIYSYTHDTDAALLFSTLFPGFYYVYPLIGTFFISMIVLGLAKIKRRSSD